MINPEHIHVETELDRSIMVCHVKASCFLEATHSASILSGRTSEDERNAASAFLWNFIYGDILTTVTEILAMDSEQAKTKALRRLEEKLRAPSI